MGELVNVVPCRLSKIGLGIIDQEYHVVIGLMNPEKQQMLVGLTEDTAVELHADVERYLEKLRSYKYWSGPESN